MASSERSRDAQPNEAYHDVPLSDEGHGLGIQLQNSPRHDASPRQVFELPAGNPTHHTASDHHSLISPASSSGFSGTTAYVPSPIDSPVKLSTKRSTNSTWSSLHTHGKGESQVTLIRKDSIASPLGRYHSLSSSEGDCDLQAIKSGRTTLISMATLGLAAYATATSGLFVYLATARPGYHHFIKSTGPITPDAANLLTSTVAKTTEMAFITVFLAWLGQMLSRRAADGVRRRSGFTLAELNMRNWVVQPGTMFSRSESVRYAGLTMLGLVSMVAAVCATFYIPATSALVSPQLRFPNWQTKVLGGPVRAKFGNNYYIKEQCRVPESVDPNDSGVRTSQCSTIEHAANAYHNFYAYLGEWNDYSALPNASTSLADRPTGFAMYNDTVTVRAPWVPPDNPATPYKDTGIIVNNVSLAFPHVGVIAAAQDPLNGIMQPSDLKGIGAYNIRASVPSPVIHVLCATVSEEQVYPYISSDWLQTHTTNLKNATLAGNSYSDPYRYLNGTTDATPLHEIFKWGEEYGAHRWAPVFPRIPGNDNTIMNGTGMDKYARWGREAIYIIGNGTSSDNGAGHYFMCQLQVSLEPNCYTRYNATGTGATAEAVCDDSTDKLRYIDKDPAALSGNDTLDQEWPNVATAWGESLAFDTGPSDNNAATPWLLSRLVLRDGYLSTTTPSAAEALAVMAGCTLLQSSEDAPFNNRAWNYTEKDGANNVSILAQPVYQYFNASVQAQQYASGGTKAAQYLFLPVLLGGFLLSLYALIYFIRHNDWYTDFSEPSNLFTLAVNSPPSDALAASCATGPKGKDYAVAWRLAEDDGRVYVKSYEPGESAKVAKKRKGWRERFELDATPQAGDM